MIYLPNDNFQYYYPHSNALFIIFPLKLYYFASNERCQQRKTRCQPMKSDVM